MAFSIRNYINEFDKRYAEDEANRKQLDNFYSKNPQFHRTADIPNVDTRVRGLITPPTPSIPSSPSLRTSSPNLSIFSAVDKALGKSSYDYYKSNNTPSISATKTPSVLNNSSAPNEVFGQKSWNFYKANNPDTPDLIKPIGYALESPFRIPFVNRLTKAITGDSGLATNAPVNTYSTDTRNNFLNGTADVVGGLAGFGLKPRLMGANGVNLMTAGDAAGKFTADNIGAKLGNNMTGRVASSVGRGIIDGAVGNAAYDMAMNKDIKDLPKSALIGAVGGAALMGGGKLASEGINKLKFPDINFGNLDSYTPKTNSTPNTEVLNTPKANTLEDMVKAVVEGNKPNISTPKLNMEDVYPKNNGLLLNAGKEEIPQVNINDYKTPKMTAKQTQSVAKFDELNNKRGIKWYQDNDGDIYGVVKTPEGYGGSIIDKKGVISKFNSKSSPADYGFKEVNLGTGRTKEEVLSSLDNIISTLEKHANDTETKAAKFNSPFVESMSKSVPKASENTANASILQKNFPVGSKVSFNANMGRGKGEVIGYKTDKWGNEWVEVDTGVKSQTGIGTIKDFKRIDDDIKLEGSNKTMAANIENNTTQKNIPLPQNESTVTNNDEIAAALGNQVKESKFKTNTWENSPFMADEATQKMVKDIDATYDVQTNDENLQVAMYRLNKDFNGVVDRITKEGIQTAEDSVASGLITNRLIQEAKQTGDYSKVSSWLKVVRPEVTNLAQSLQALSTWKRLTPEGTLLKAQKIVDGAVDKIKKENPKKFEEVQKQIQKNPDMADEILKKNNIPQLSNDDIKFITDQMNKVEQMKDGRKKDIEFAKVKQLMADKIVPTFTDKIKAAQRISLLLNTKTMTRNILGNVVMSGLENAKDIPGAAIDKVISKTTGKRTTLMPSVEGLKTQVKGGIKGTKEAIEDFKLGVNTNPSAGQYELPSSQAFKGGVMGKLEKVTNAGLTLGDRPFWQGAYDDSLRQQLKINKVKEPTEEMIKQATDVANERTFQNTNALVKGFKDIQKALNLGKDIGLGNLVIPFTKTPANILDKAIDYSPIGGMKGIYNLVNGLKKGTLNQKQVVDQLGRGITGSTLMAIGYAMAKGGVLTGQANKDKDVSALEKQAGKSPYAVKTGDTYRTIDWMQPAAIPLMIGADIYHQGKNEKELKNVIASAVVSGGNTLFNQSLLQGIQKFFNTSNSSSGGIMENIGNTITQAPTQFVPSALKEVNQLIDNKQRDTSGGVVNQIKAKIPGLAQTLPVKYDTMGREMTTYKNGNNLWNVGFNPGFTTKYSPSDGEKASLDIFEENGSKTQFPQVMDNKITYTDSKTKKKAVVSLTPKEKQEFQKNVGQRVENQFKYIHGGTAEDKIKDMEKILRDIKKEEQDKILRAKGLSRK